MAPNLCPARTASSKVLLDTSAPRKLPANASPAPLVSTICPSSRRVMGMTFGLSGTASKTATVKLGPWVIMTVRDREGFDLESFAIELAMVGISSLSGSPMALAQLVNVSIRGGHSASKTEELVVGSSVGGGEGEVRDHSESEAPNKARMSTFFLRVALDGSGSVAVLGPTSVSVLNSSGVLKTFGHGACMLFTTESRRALAFNVLSWDIGCC